MPQTLDQRTNQASRRHRHKGYPKFRERRCHDGDRNHGPATPDDPRRHLHHLAIGKNVRTADLADSPGGLLVEAAMFEDLQDVRQRNGLGPRRCPTGTDHYGQTLDQANEKVQRRALRTHDQTCTNRRDGHTVRSQSLLDFETTGQMRREARTLARRQKAAQIDDAPNAGYGRCAREVVREQEVQVLESTLCESGVRAHGMNQVDCDLRAHERGVGLTHGEQVATSTYDAGNIESHIVRRFDSGRVSPPERNDRTFALESRGQRISDEAGGSGDRDPQRLALFRRYDVTPVGGFRFVGRNGCTTFSRHGSSTSARGGGAPDRAGLVRIRRRAPRPGISRARSRRRAGFGRRDSPRSRRKSRAFRRR